MGLEMDFLRPKNRANRPGCVELAGAGAEMDADLGIAATTGAEAGDGSTGGVEAGGAAVSLRKTDESAEPVRRRKLDLLKMAVPMVELSRSVLLVPVDEEAGGKGNLGFVLLLLERVDEGARSDAFLAEAERES